MTHRHAHGTRMPNPLPVLPDRSWAARAAALRQERPAQWAMLAGIASLLTMLAGFTAKLAFSGFMVPFALAAAGWCGRLALRALPGVLEVTQADLPVRRRA